MSSWQPPGTVGGDGEVGGGVFKGVGEVGVEVITALLLPTCWRQFVHLTDRQIQLGREVIAKWVKVDW